MVPVVILLVAEYVVHVPVVSGIIVKRALRPLRLTENERKCHFFRVNGMIEANSVDMKTADASKYYRVKPPSESSNDTETNPGDSLFSTVNISSKKVPVGFELK